MEKSELFKMHVRAGRHYIYKGNEYIVKELTMVKNDAEGVKNWKPGIVYGKAIQNDAEQPMTYTRDLEDFLIKFVPVSLEIGDYVEVVSMGKTKGFLKVSSINDGMEFPVQFENNENVFAKREIDFHSLKIEVNKHEQATDYYVLMPQETAADYHRMASESIRKIKDLKNMIDIGSTGSMSPMLDARQVIKKVFSVLKDNS